MRLLLPALAAALLATPPRDARACSPMPCVPYDVVPSGGTIPANASALGLRATMVRELDASKVKLHAPDGAELALAFAPAKNDGFQRLTPSAPLSPGSGYTLEVFEECLALGTAGTWRTVRFDVGAAAQIPSQIGTLRALPQRAVEDVVIPGGPACFDRADGVAVDFALAPDPALAPWWPLVQLRLEVDGRIAFNERHGSPAIAAGELTEPADSKQQASALRVTRICEKPDGGGGVVTTPAGQHTARMVATLFGTDRELASNTVTFTVLCPGEELDDGPLQGTDDDDEGAREGGCATGAIAWGSLGALALLLRRRSSR